MSAVIYEVNLFVRRAIEREYRDWLDAHIREILALPGFVSAELFEVIEPAPWDPLESTCRHASLSIL